MIDTHKNGHSRINPTPYSGLGKLPPQATDLEEAVLGALLLEKNALLSVVENLKPENFYKDSHQKIYSVIIKLFAENSPIDLLTVTAYLRKAGELEMIGGAYYLTELTNRVVGAANIEFHAAIILEKFIQREMIRISTETIQLAYDDTTDTFSMVEINQVQVFNLLNDKRSNNIVDNAALAAQIIIDVKKPEITGLIGVGAGFECVDEMTNGWRNSDLIIIAARPSMGKTAFALQLARNAAIDFGVPTFILSLEMSKDQLSERLICSESLVFLDKLQKHKLDTYELERIETSSKKLLEQNKIFIDDTPAINLLEARAKCRRLKSKHNIGLIVIDYLQLMRGSRDKNSNREQEIASISQGLKAIAKELNVPVIALSQLNRLVENRAGGAKRPQLSDIRESGAIEQDADKVIFMYRPEYYGITQDEDGNDTKGLTELIFAKNRNGICGTLKLEFNGAFMKFRDWNKVKYDNVFTEVKPKEVIEHPDFKIDPSVKFDEDVF